MAKPLLFITGFLGVGKTTLLRAILDDLRKLGRNADVILNDYENAEIDAATLPASDASVFPLAASCACCDSLDDLVQLCLAATRSEGDVLLIELNGTADPLPLLEAFTLLEEKMPFFPRWQVGVVDARHWQRRQEFGALEARQVETATHWVLTHTDEPTASEAGEVARSVELTNRFATRVDARRLAADLDAAIAGPPPKESAADATRSDRNCAVEKLTRDHEHELSHCFAGCQIPLPGRYRRRQVVRFLESLPEEVVRAKALVRLSEAPGCRWLFERTGRSRVEQPLRVETISRVSTSLVCIGPGIDPRALRELVKSSFGI